MNINYFLSSDGKTEIAYYIYDNVEKPVAVLQIAHGMQEHITRYSKLAEFLNSYGIVVVGNDHLGHGDSSKSTDTDGFFANKNGAKLVLKDINKMTKIAKEKYPNLPFILMGHSMGSFFARMYASVYHNELDGLILCGTSGKVAGSGLGLLVINLIKLLRGKKAKSKLVEKIVVSSYFKYIKEPETQFDWLTRDKNAVQEYLRDKQCAIKFTASAYYDMVSTLVKVNKKSWAKKVEKDLPILLVSGALDPVGQYGKGVCQVYKLLEHQGVKNIDLKLYAGARHEPHNEIEPVKSQFFQDVKNFIMQIVNK